MSEIPGPPVTCPTLYERCLKGDEPGEWLDSRAAGRLVGDLWLEGWTDTEIAVHTRWTELVVAKKRIRLGLPPRALREVA